MAMTKKERAEMDAAIGAAKTLAALRWTDPVEKDVHPPASFDKYLNGWIYNEYGGLVMQAWTSSVCHGKGCHSEGGKRPTSASQNSIRMYSTRLLAMKALRHAIELECAKKLMQIDLAIDAERLSE